MLHLLLYFTIHLLLMYLSFYSFLKEFSPRICNLGEVSHEPAPRGEIFSCNESTCMLTFKTRKEAEENMDAGNMCMSQIVVQVVMWLKRSGPAMHRGTCGKRRSTAYSFRTIGSYKYYRVSQWRMTDQAVLSLSRTHAWRYRPNVFACVPTT